MLKLIDKKTFTPFTTYVYTMVEESKSILFTFTDLVHDDDQGLQATVGEKALSNGLHMCLHKVIRTKQA